MKTSRHEANLASTLHEARPEITSNTTGTHYRYLQESTPEVSRAITGSFDPSSPHDIKVLIGLWISAPRWFGPPSDKPRLLGAGLNRSCQFDALVSQARAPKQELALDE